MNLTDLPFELFEYGIYSHLDSGSKAALWMTNSWFRRGSPPRLEPKDYCHSSLNFYLYFHPQFSFFNIQNEMITAASLGNLSVLQYIVNEHYIYDDYLSIDLCMHAASSGSIPCLEYLVENGWQLTSKACRRAAQNGHLHVLKWLRDKGCPWDVLTVINAARSGQMEILDYCIENKCPINSNAAFAAMRNGHVRCFQRLVEVNPKIISYELGGRVASRHGQIWFLEAIRRQKKLVPHYNLAIQNQQIEVVKYLYNHGYEISQINYLSAVKTRNLQLVQLLDDWQISRHPESLVNAAKDGDLPMVKYLHQTGSTLPNMSIPIEVFSHRDSKVLEYLNQSGFFIPDPINIIHVSYNCLMYLCSIGHRLTIQDGLLIVEYLNLKMLQLYHRFGGPLIRQMAVIASKMDKVDHLKFLIDWGCPYDLSIYEQALNYYSWKCVKYLRPFFDRSKQSKRRNSF